MGISWIRKIRAAKKINMKFFAVSALVAIACAEAEPKADAGYGYGMAKKNSTQRYAYHHFGKSSTEAEPKADADVVQLGGNFAPLTYGTQTYGVHPYQSAYTYGAYPYKYGSYGYAKHYGKRSAESKPKANADAYHHYGKRSAEAEPKAVYGMAKRNSTYHSAYTYDANGYNYGAYGYGHHYGKRSAEAEPKADADIVQLGGNFAPLTYGS